MRSQAICLILALVLLCPFASAQGIQTHGLDERQFPHRPVTGADVFQETQLLDIPTQHRMQAYIKSRLDSLRARRMQSTLPDERFTPNRNQRSPRPLRKMSSAQSQLYVIDTAIVRKTLDTVRHLYSFNAKAMKTSDLTQRLTGDLWVDTWRETYAYDASTNMLSDLQELWNGQWVREGFCGTYTYDGQGNMIVDLQEEWSNGQGWNKWLSTYTYDANGNRLTWLWEKWYDGEWVDYQRYTYTYDGQGNMIANLQEEWSTGQWVSSWRITYTYDGSGNRLAELMEGWSTGQWVSSWRITYTYDRSGNMLTDLHEGWENGQWVNNERNTYTYDGSGNRLSWLSEVWNDGEWVGFSRSTCTYDASGNMLTDLHESWGNAQWVSTTRRTFTYDVEGNVIAFWNYSWLNGSWSPANLPAGGFAGRQYFQITDSAGNNYYYWGYNVTCTRKLLVTGVACQSGNVPATYSLSQNYPNPFNPSTTIKFELPRSSEVRLSVFDMLGREVTTLVNEKRDAGVHEVKCDGSSLASGVYFYRLQAGEFTQTKPLLLLR
jgi:hypothetical protein